MADNRNQIEIIVNDINKSNINDIENMAVIEKIRNSIKKKNYEKTLKRVKALEKDGSFDFLNKSKKKDVY